MSKNTQKTRKTRRRESQEERRREEEQRRIAKKRRTLWISAIVGVVVVVVTAIVITNIVKNNNASANTQAVNSSKATITSIPNITSDNPNFPVVNDIACQANEQLAYHNHAHLSIYVNGSAVSLPAGIGIAPDNSCIYWLHTHDSNGVIHIESPNANTYSLGTFFKLWEDHFSALGYPSQLNTTDGWTIYVNGKPYTGDFHAIQLLRHELITMAYNSPNVTPDTAYSWGSL
jgi:hypothetical protein